MARRASTSDDARPLGASALPSASMPHLPIGAAPPPALERTASFKKVRFSVGGSAVAARDDDDDAAAAAGGDSLSGAASSSSSQRPATQAPALALAPAHAAAYPRRLSRAASAPVLGDRSPTNHSDQASVAHFVSSAVSSKAKGKTVLYHSLVELLAKRPTDKGALTADQIRLYLASLTLNVSQLSAGFQSLILAVLAIDWLGQDALFVQTYCHFLENLVSAHAVYVGPVAKTLVQHLRNGVRQNPRMMPSMLFERTHTALERILRLVPTGPSFLVDILKVNFPHKSQDIETQVYYVRSLLRIAQYAPVLRNQILGVIVEGIVQIDVDIQIEIEELDEEELEAIQETVFSMDDLDMGASSPQGETSGGAAHVAGSRAAHDGDGDEGEHGRDSDSDSDDSDHEGGFTPITSDIKTMVEKLDALLSLLFQYIHEVHQASERSGAGELTSLFHVFLDIFDRIMIPTHRLRCTQFLLFYLCSLSRDFPGDMMGLLISRLSEVSSPAVIRISAAAYLGSFVSRAKFVEIESVRLCLRLLNQFVQNYLDSNEAAMGSRIQVDRFGVFYSAVQAILYVFCFRWRELMVVGDTLLVGQMPAELKGFQRVLLSRFAPLKVCSEPIAQEFAKIMHSLNIMYCFPLIGGSAAAAAAAAAGGGVSSGTQTPSQPGIVPDMARTASQSSFSGIGGSVQDLSYAVIERLDSFFPFDPLTLPRSRGYIAPLYQEWQGSDENNVDSEVDSHSTHDIEFDSDDEADGLGGGLGDDDDDDRRANDPMSTSLG
nr:hypothetical protein HK105_000406 [Polyrhizophydium stewartii]